MTCHLHVSTDGEDALAFLFHRGSHSVAVRPDVILLDLTLPRHDGRELLAELRCHDDLSAIPVFVLSASRLERDVLLASELAVEGYVAKSSTLEQLDLQGSGSCCPSISG